MLTKQENERLTRGSPGAPMGELMGRYWHPIAASAEFDDRITKSVRLLGKDLVLSLQPVVDGDESVGATVCPSGGRVARSW